jgi:hypothetical protein
MLTIGWEFKAIKGYEHPSLTIEEIKLDTTMILNKVPHHRGELTPVTYCER